MAFIHVPEELGKLLAQNADAANAFSMMTTDQKKAVIQKANHTHTALGKQRLIAQLAKEGRV